MVGFFNFIKRTSNRNLCIHPTHLYFLFRWDAMVERAWLSLFRFIEFWMGLSYMEPDGIDSTLASIVKDPRLPGGAVDTEYISGHSKGAANEPKPSERQILANMMSDTPELATSNHTEQDKVDMKEGIPPWLT